MLTTTIFFTLLTLLTCSLAAATCSNSVLFPSSVMGKTHTQHYPCYPRRCPSTTRVEVNENNIIYVPPHGEYNDYRFCHAYYRFHLNDWPVMIYYPRVEKPAPEEHIGCVGAQHAQQVVAAPRGARREQYIDGLNKTIIALTKMRDFGCPSDGTDPIEEEYLNPWLEAPITYLRSIAYNHGICLDFNTDDFSFEHSQERC
eukprot:TRINITY_DN40595_c0_g1_i1.p1 TRINITY_DN40595_c0_g1~~TRINITY_DN40595_c0_g1_i1.p1  ORF type:complete len:200 (+),score=15.72 TRINITY_DN40595_c0_g1_i1:383-982(+)